MEEKDTGVITEEELDGLDESGVETEEQLEALDEGDIEVRFELFTDAIEMENVDYHHIFEGMIKRDNEIRNQKITKQARYNVEDGSIEWKDTYYRENEIIEETTWIQFGSVNKTGEFAESGEVTASTSDWVVEGNDLKEAIEKCVKRIFFSSPHNELGEIYYDMTGKL